MNNINFDLILFWLDVKCNLIEIWDKVFINNTYKLTICI